MLDTKTTFDQLVTQYAEDEEQSQRILANGFYRNIAGALSGTQEYMAMEKLYELHASGTFELIVVDTPPTRHALDFLDAPRRLTRLLDNRIFRLLMAPTRTTFRVTSAAAHAFVRTVARVVGREVIDDIIAFFRAFEGMEAGFRDRANQVMTLLGAPETAFVLVTTPRRDAVEEGEYFAERLTEHGMTVEGLIVNRVHRALRPRLTRSAPSTRVGAAVERERCRGATRGALRESRRPRGGSRARASRACGARRASGQCRSRARPRTRPRRLRLRRAARGRSTSDGLRAPSCSRRQGIRLACHSMSTVMVAAEGKWVRDLVKAACLAPGQRVVEVTRGQDVRAAVAEYGPEVAVLDMQIANMGGIAVAIDLRLEGAAGRLPDVSILLLLDREADRFLAKRADADAELVKPIDPSTLRRTIDRLVAAAAVTTEGPETVEG